LIILRVVEVRDGASWKEDAVPSAPMWLTITRKIRSWLQTPTRSLLTAYKMEQTALGFVPVYAPTTRPLPTQSELQEARRRVEFWKVEGCLGRA